ncbi:hypothetical protein BpHYR1_017231 [Brachionus plicatilis]|uniref:Uncharacterized protein n=1 Tax=Brachionus plicatilis TaxID=10195 RepID=A0A3M7Q656_BRAPC|nr:hypothetical protein BpHYR1_017231 [Brachionus plicatilis]
MLSDHFHTITRIGDHTKIYLSLQVNNNSYMENIDEVSFNKQTSELRLGLKEFWNQNWLEFMNKIGKNPLSNGKEYNSDTDKGKIFVDPLCNCFIV